MMSLFDSLAGRLRAFGLSRLLFAVITLSMTLSGTIANYVLSGNALKHFDTLLELNDADTFIVSGTAADVKSLSHGKFDATALAEEGPGIITPLLPSGFKVVPFRTFAVSASTGGSAQLTKAYAAGSGFAQGAGLSIDNGVGPASVSTMEDACLIGTGLANQMGYGPGEGIWIDGKRCTVAGQFSAPVRPPFADLSNAVLMPAKETSFEPVMTNNFSFLITGPPGSLTATRLQALLGLIFDASKLTVWSSQPIVEKARELKFVASAISVGLSAIILMVGAVSIASLMSFSVTERRREIAVRRTLGATRGRIVVEIVEETALIASLALAIGIVGGIALAHVLEQPLSRLFLVGSTSGDLAILPIVKAVGGFFVVSMLSGIIPALNAARTDPATVLRES